LLIGIVCLLLQAAAAMCVGMGSFSDPFEAQGLAHFLGLIIYHLSTDKLVSFGTEKNNDNQLATKSL
jgi:hypothetical protein